MTAMRLPITSFYGQIRTSTDSNGHLHQKQNSSTNCCLDKKAGLWRCDIEILLEISGKDVYIQYRSRPVFPVEKNSIRRTFMSNDFGNAVNEYFVKEFRRLYRKRAERIAALKTPADILARAENAKRRIREVFALEKRPRTPLNPQITAVHNYKYYIKKNIYFESLPGFYVTANLYLPSEAAEPVPAVLHLCGHNHDGKACANGVSLNTSLAANGIAVLAIDPVCQGERYQHFMEDELNLCGAHNMLGKELILSGENFSSWRAWDAIRAIDLICELPELDKNRIMLTGCSGGGTMTAWVNALEDRLIAAAPSCAVTEWRRTVENELPIDAEQMPFSLAGEGFDMADFLIASLPRPILICGETNDFFDERGQQAAGRELEILSERLNAPLKSTFFTGPESHGLKPAQREAIRNFFFKAAGVISRGITENEIPRPTPEETCAAPGGDVFNIPGNLPALELLKQRNAANTSGRFPMSKEELKDRLRQLLHLPEIIPVPEDHRRLPLKSFKDSPVPVNRYLIENDERILGVLHAVTGTNNYQIPRCKEAVFYIADQGCGELETLPEELYRDKILFGFDSFGIGELTPSSCSEAVRDRHHLYGSYWHFAGVSTMLGKNFPGLQMEGILAAVRLLNSLGIEKLTVAGRNYSVPLAVYTSLLAEECVGRTILFDPPPAFEDLTGTYNKIPLSVLLPEILKYTDWPEIAQTVNAEFTGATP